MTLTWSIPRVGSHLLYLSFVGLLCFGASCGGSSPPPSSATTEPEQSPAAASDEPAAVDEAPSDQPSASVGDAAAEEGAPEAEPAADKNPAMEQLRLTYRMTETGLTVDASGVRFLANVKPVRVGDGWGVEVSVEGSVKDDKKHNLLSPKGGPLAFAGEVKRKGQSARFGDKRQGDTDETLSPGKPFKTTRTWPGSTGEQALTAGDELKLEVGLWGFGDNAQKRRPVRDFLLIKMKVGKNKPLPLLEPPASAQGG
jgi:hypothetical protein